MSDFWPSSAAFPVACVLLGVAAGCSTELDGDRPWLGSLGSAPCAEEVRSMLFAWGVGEEMLVSPPTPGLLARYRFPTDELGVWLQLDVGDSEATVSRVEPDRVVVRTFAPDCVGSSHEEPGRLPDGGAERFTDADLRRVIGAAVREGSRGVVVYTWSPHMPLSVEGYREIETAAMEHGLDLVPVLFPGSDARFAEAEAERAGIPSDGLRQASSVELTFRSAQVHAPSILVFDGERASAVLPGYRTAEGYREFLTGFLAP